MQAARLSSMAAGGQVLVTELVRALAAPSSTHLFTEVGAPRAEGPRPPRHRARAGVVRGRQAAGCRCRCACAARRRRRTSGRVEEVAAVERAWAAAAAGRGGLVLLAGEPGIGKTRLASRQAFAVHAAGGTVLYGAVDEGLGVPYQPWIEALGHYLDHAPDGLIERYVAEAGADLARLLPDLGRRVPYLPALVASDGETERYLLLQAITRFLRAAAEHNPVLLVLDDLHWADKPTLLLLRHLHRELADAPVLFVGTFRDSELNVAPALADALASLRREERVERIELEGLVADDIVDLLEAISRQEATPAAVELARLLQRDTNGNPLFVAEVLRDLLEQGHLAPGDDGVWALTTPIEQLPAPASVRDVVAQRVERLGPEAQRLLTTAAVVGRDFELDLLGALLDQPPDDLLEVIEEAMAASLLTETGSRSGGFRFIHAVIAQALVDSLSGTRRVQLHRRIAATIEELHGPDLGDRVATVARHLLAAEEDPAKTIDYVRRAGSQALAALAPDEALRWFQTALDLYDRSPLAAPELRCDIVTDLGEAMRDAGHPGSRDHLISAAQLAGVLHDGPRLARAILAMNRSIATSVGAADQELIATMESALALADRPDATRARLLAQLASELSIIGTLDRRRALVEEALSIARSLDDHTLARVITSSLGAYFTTAAHAERKALLEGARRAPSRGLGPAARWLRRGVGGLDVVGVGRPTGGGPVAGRRPPSIRGVPGARPRVAAAPARGHRGPHRRRDLRLRGVRAGGARARRHRGAPRRLPLLRHPDGRDPDRRGPPGRAGGDDRGHRSRPTRASTARCASSWPSRWSSAATTTPRRRSSTRRWPTTSGSSPTPTRGG